MGPACVSRSVSISLSRHKARFEGPHIGEYQGCSNRNGRLWCCLIALWQTGRHTGHLYVTGREWKVRADHFWHILTQDARAQKKVSCVGSQSCQGTPGDQVVPVLYHAARLVVFFLVTTPVCSDSKSVKAVAPEVHSLEPGYLGHLPSTPTLTLLCLLAREYETRICGLQHLAHLRLL